MADIIKQNRAVVWVQENGDGTSFIPYADREDGMAMTGKSIPVKGLTPVYARDAAGNPVVIAINETAPGDLPTATIQIYEKAALQVLENMVSKQCPLNFQLRMVACGPLDNPFIWDKITALSIIVMNAPSDTSFITTAMAVPAAGGCSTSKATMSKIANPTERGYSTKYGRLVK